MLTDMMGPYLMAASMKNEPGDRMMGTSDPIIGSPVGPGGSLRIFSKYNLFSDLRRNSHAATESTDFTMMCWDWNEVRSDWKSIL